MMFMNRKGFTLVELLAVIFVLGLLVAIISPIVTNLLNDSKESLRKNQIDTVITAAKRYMIDHPDLLPERNNVYSVSINDLISSGVIENDKVVDPKTKKILDGCVVVRYVSNYNQYEYSYSDLCS